MHKWLVIAWASMLIFDAVWTTAQWYRGNKADDKLRSALLPKGLFGVIGLLLLGRSLLGEEVPTWVEWAFGVPMAALFVVWLGISLVRLKRYLQHAEWLKEWKKK